ncbi:MAG: methyltransferase domain-containing protein [Flavobacteriales bacterium]
MNCRFCEHILTHEFVDLANSPASNSYLSAGQLNEPETFYPLKVFVCEKCWLVQIDEYKKSNAIFNGEYAYFSSFSTSWLAHAKAYTDLMMQKLNLNTKSLVIEVASNDGYLLQYFKEKNIPVLGIEPTANTAEAAREKGIETLVDFMSEKFAVELAVKKKKADLLLGNNVLAHVPDIIDFLKGMKTLLGEQGVITMEFPHVAQLIDNVQFDTIYHEHFSYLSFFTVKQMLESVGLIAFDVEELPTHGGSLRVYAAHKGDSSKKISANVEGLIAKELAVGINKVSYYSNFQSKVQKVKNDLLSFLLNQVKNNKTVAGYGAAAKGNTLLNYSGIKNDLIQYVVDANPHKQGKFLPGSHIPIVNEAHLKTTKPDYVIIFPWNLKEEIMSQLNYIRNWKGKFVICLPQLSIIN